MAIYTAKSRRTPNSKQPQSNAETESQEQSRKPKPEAERLSRDPWNVKPPRNCNAAARVGYLRILYHGAREKSSEKRKKFLGDGKNESTCHESDDERD